MYLYIGFFKQEALNKGEILIEGKYFQPIKSAFPELSKLKASEIKGCIGYLLGKGNNDKKSFLLQVTHSVVNDISMTISYYLLKEINVTSGALRSSLYHSAQSLDWVDRKTGYIPLVCIVDEEKFDLIRKGSPNIKKAFSNLAEVNELKKENNWLDICKIYEPLEEVSKKDDLWNNVYALSEIAFACSKMGEPKNEKKRDLSHLAYVKRYRNLSIEFFKRCCELEPQNPKHYASLGYRYYINAIELGKNKARRDGVVADEVVNAHFYFDKALALNPNRIKENYRKGKLILDIQIPNILYGKNELTAGVFAQIEGLEKAMVDCFNNVIKQYEKLEPLYQKRSFNEFVKAHYNLGRYYIDKPRNRMFNYADCLYSGIDFINDISSEEMRCIVKAKYHMEKSFAAESNVELDKEFEVRLLFGDPEKWVVSPIFKLYRLGLIYLHMFFVKVTKSNQSKSNNTCGKKADFYLKAAKIIGDEYKQRGIRGYNTWYISDKLAWYYIIRGDYSKAVNLLSNCNDSYIRNTQATALLLTKKPENYSLAESTLKAALNDKNNLQMDRTKALLDLLTNNG